MSGDEEEEEADNDDEDMGSKQRQNIVPATTSQL